MLCHKIIDTLKRMVVGFRVSMLDAGLPRKEDPEDKLSDLWTAPSYFDITLCGLGDDFGAPARHPLLCIKRSERTSVVSLVAAG